METSDITIPNGTEPPGTQTRYTAHVFRLLKGRIARAVVPLAQSGAPVRVPADTRDWPSDVLFDIVYAAAVLTHFGTSIHDDRTAWSTWTAQLYTDCVSRYQHLIDASAKKRAEEEQALTPQQIADRRERYETRPGAPIVPGSFDDIRADPLRFWWTFFPPEQVEAHIRRQEEKATAEERTKLEEKVTSWRASLPG